MVITAAWTGCRWGELAGLHRDNVDLGRGVIVIDPLVGALHESGRCGGWVRRRPGLRRGRSRCRRFWLRCCASISRGTRYGFVFTTPSGTWLWRSTFLRRVFRPAVDGRDASGAKAGCAAVRPGLTFHGLRHSHKTWLIAGGAPEIAQARRLGHHPDNRAIETYSHVARRSSSGCWMISSAAGAWRHHSRPRSHRRWTGGARCHPLHHGGGHSPTEPTSSGNTGWTPDRGWGSAPVLPQREHKITP
ncbi:tyrosine-type recombinase/integrase [Amycolatopsis sp. RTGN1]|uniref:tyrosine-type recombinase/integrase n=1 Tax=Amycolatopsis ponsaeliensis TaxID=2992142 RepID=UPI003307743F